MLWKILANVITLGIPAVIEAIAKARRKKREQVARLKREELLARRLMRQTQPCNPSKVKKIAGD